MKACALNSALFAFLFTLTFLGFHVTGLTPIVVFVSGVAVRTLQQTVLRSAWFLGTAVPLAVRYLVAGPLANGHGPSPLWVGAVVRWTGLTMACYSPILLSRSHHAINPS